VKWAAFIVVQASYRSRLFSPENLPNIGLFVAGVAGIIVALCTLKILRDQTDAAVKAADAAKESADALMLAERPWVVPRITRTATTIDTVRDGKPGLKDVTYFTFSITNNGRTPAEVLAIRGNPQITYEGRDGGFTDPPDYGLPIGFKQVRMLAPGETWDYRDPDLNIRLQYYTDEALKNEIETYKSHYIFKGVVLYRDSFRPEVIHESRFCYTYFAALDEYGPSGPPEHTKYT
jgi:Co/Zn/Cd efflux system component